MCQAFSCIVDKDKKVWWELGIDSHSGLIDISPYKDRDDCHKFVRIEITPDNDDYLFPSNWTLKIDSESCPRWFSPSHKQSCFIALGQWLQELEKFIVRKKVVHPFLDIKPPRRISKKVKFLLKDWDSVRGSVWDSVWDSVGGSVWDSVGGSVWDSVRGSVWGSVGGSVWGSVRDSVWGYAGSFFKLDKWKYIEYKKDDYPYNSVVILWEKYGLVPSFDGKIWRLHGGKKAKILFEISQTDLKKYGGE